MEALFIDDRVQDLLKQLTGLDLEHKIFSERLSSRVERSHYALMTNDMLEEVRLLAYCQRQDDDDCL